MTSQNVYENLYNSMKDGLTVVSKDGEYCLGDYMLMKAEKHREATTLPVSAANAKDDRAISAFFTYVNDKLTIKAPPVKDKTIRRFPLRTSLSAVLSALVACTLVLSYGATVLRANEASTASTVEVVDAESESEE
jgi:hypothetical protein